MCPSGANAHEVERHLDLQSLEVMVWRGNEGESRTRRERKRGRRSQGERKKRREVEEDRIKRIEVEEVLLGSTTPHLYRVVSPSSVLHSSQLWLHTERTVLSD